MKEHVLITIFFVRQRRCRQRLRSLASRYPSSSRALLLVLTSQVLGLISVGREYSGGIWWTRGDVVAVQPRTCRTKLGKNILCLEFYFIFSFILTF
jgi:hypothetical protein